MYLGLRADKTNMHHLTCTWRGIFPVGGSFQSLHWKLADENRGGLKMDPAVTEINNYYYNY